ncbi:MAG: hypothetical protein OEY22_08680 [Candidatus Bathyarchaeota archaeon]|nr:hypothetical protein [Candidatus Bathyarchaeota archaeon]MDH5787472.1 hypothetical protein [Candidatus Bathyarchaeota archaeon]
MNLREYHLFFVVVFGIVALIVASPALSRLLVYPRTVFFTELWYVGSNHMAEDLPFNITRNENYSIFLGLSNRLGSCAYYLVEVKFRNQTQPAPTSFGPIENRTPSSLPSLYNISAFVEDEGVWELPLTFSFDYEYDDVFLQVRFYNMALNGVVLDMTDYVTSWNSTRSDFFGSLFFELWIYNTTGSNFQYHGRFVSLRLNMTG